MVAPMPRAALLLATLARVHGDGAPPSPPKLLDAAGLATLRASQQPAVVRFSPEDCGVDCSTLSQAWDHFSQFLPPGRIWERPGDSFTTNDLPQFSWQSRPPPIRVSASWP